MNNFFYCFIYLFDLNYEIRDEKMQKIQKPKRMNVLDKDLLFETLIEDDTYIEGVLFGNCHITNQIIDRLYLNKCHFKNVTFENCQFGRIDLSDTTF